jgi:hypothetical protein
MYPTVQLKRETKGMCLFDCERLKPFSGGSRAIIISSEVGKTLMESPRVVCLSNGNHQAVANKNPDNRGIEG